MISTKGVITLILLLCIIIFYLLFQRKMEQFDNYYYLKKNKDNMNTTTMSIFDGINDGSLTPQTISNKTNLELQNILGSILNNINTKTNMRYFLRKIDRVNIEPLKKGIIGCENLNVSSGEFIIGARYTVDFFAHELKNQHTRRFIIVFIVNNNLEVKVEHMNLSNALTFKEKDFMDYSSDTLILTDDTLGKNKYHISGINDGSIDYSLFNSDTESHLNSKKRVSAMEMGQMLMPVMVSDINENNIEKHASLLYPNRKQSKWWDKNGVFYTECHNSKIPKIGINHGYGTRPPQIYDNPTVVRGVMNSHTDKNHYLFKASRGNFGIPRGQVVN